MESRRGTRGKCSLIVLMRMILLSIFNLGSVRPSGVAEHEHEQLLQEKEATVHMLEFVERARRQVKLLKDKKRVEESAEEDEWTVGSNFFCFQCRLRRFRRVKK